MASKTSRRRFLWAVVGVGAGVLAAACGGTAAPTSAPSKPTEPAKPAAGEATKPAPVLAAPIQPNTPAPAATVAATAAPAATPASSAKPGAAPRRGGAITVLVQNDWVRLDPIFESGAGAGFHLLFDQYLKWVKDANGVWNLGPALFAEWNLEPNQITFKLQKGVKFHDGTPWDAKAAKWNLDRLIFHPGSLQKSLFAGIDASKEDKAELDKLKAPDLQTFDFSSKAIEVVDESTVRVRLKGPSPGFLAGLTSPTNSPISPTAYAKMGRDAFGRAPVGAGPFKFAEWKSADHITLERFPDYYRMGADAKPLPYLDKITMRLVIDDSARLLELRSGNSDFMDSIQGKDVATVKNDANLVYLDSDGQGLSRRLTVDGHNPSSPFVKQPDLRKALQYGIDRAAMAKALGLELGTPDRWIFQKSSWAYDESAPYYSFDKAKAQQIVQDTLAKDKSLAGPNGKIPITLTVISRAVDKTQAEIVQQMLGAVGFDVTIEVLERAAYVAKIVQLPGKAGADYHISSVQNGISPDDPDAHPRRYFYSQGGQNYTHLDIFDDLVEKAAGTYDQAERKKLYRQFMDKDYQEALMVYMWFQKSNWAHNKRIKGFAEPAGGTWNLQEVWVE